jgi:5'-methylthioadenosine phosphorylase
VTVDAIIAVLNANVELSQRIVREVIPLIGDGVTSPAHSAMANAIITDRKVIPPATKERVELLVGKYL